MPTPQLSKIDRILAILKTDDPNVRTAVQEAAKDLKSLMSGTSAQQAEINTEVHAAQKGIEKLVARLENTSLLAAPSTEKMQSAIAATEQQGPALQDATKPT